MSIAGRCRQEAEALLAELLALPPERRSRRLEHERFRSGDLLGLLLQRSHEAQPPRPLEAVTLADLAAHLAEFLEERCGVARALILRGNALRLHGDFEQAEHAFERVSLFLEEGSPERAFFCRAFGLLRWEERRLDEALALLHRAGVLFHRDGSETEEAVTLLLAGLAQYETESPLRALAPLHRGFLRADPERHPWLLWRSALILSICAAEAGEALIAGEALLRAEQLGNEGRLSRDEIEGNLRHVGRMFFAFYDYGAARECLKIAVLLLKERSLPEAGLASLDLGAVLAVTGDMEGVVELVRDFQKLEASSEPVRTVIVESLQRFTDDLAFGGDPRRSRDQAVAELRRRLRALGARWEPIPFA